MEGRSSPTSHGGTGADFLAPGNQSQMSVPQGANQSGQCWNSSNNGSASAAGGVQNYTPSAQPAAGSPGRTEGNTQGTSGTGMPTPHMESSPAWLKFAAEMALMTSLTPAAKLVLEGFGSTAGVGRTVLGHFPEYLEKAKELGANRFSIPTSAWEQMSTTARWAANQKFLDRAIARGDEFILATPANLARAGSYFAQELEYLASKGYSLSADGLRMLRP